ncbi:MAG: CAP domain-containing protein [Jatrophihabitantaceae bacterium]
MSAVSLIRSGKRLATTMALCLALVASSTIQPETASATDSTPSLLTSYVISNRVFDLINSERAAHYLPALHRNSYLNWTAYKHDVKMAQYNTMWHQLPGELSLGDRMRAAGYNWRAAGENIAWNYDWTLAGAYFLEQYMYNEKAPYDSHRLAILGTAYRDVGVYIYMDAAHHKMWLTVDFGLHM